MDSLIGEGSFGKVYKIRKEEFGKTYFSAVKIISIPQNEVELNQARNEGLDEASLRSYFHAQVTDILQEIDMMNSLRGNSNIVSFEDHKVIEQSDKISWDILIRMELLTSLNANIAQKPLTEDEVIKLGVDICKALELCAQQRIIHRDIKPENIFISKFGEYKLGDFGIARQVERTSSGLSKKGTYTYMAPEVFKGEEYGASVDTYSLGVVMYRLLNMNRTPFMPDYPATITPKDREAALQRRMRGDPFPPPKNGSEALKAIALRACAYERSARFAGAGDMRKALEAVAAGREYIPEVIIAPLERDVSEAPADATSATIGVFTARPEAMPGEDKGGPQGAKLPKKRENKTIGKILPVLVVCACVLVGLIVLVINLQIRAIDLSGNGTLHKGDVFNQAYVLSPKKPLINDLTWSSSDERVLAVSEAGEVTAVGPGSATITLASIRGKISDSVTYTVRQRTKAVTGLPEGIRLATGHAVQLSPLVEPLDATDALTYESANEEIAQVDASGNIEGRQSGETSIWVSSGTIVQEIPVSVYVATEAIEGLPEKVRLALGKGLQLKPVIQPDDSEEDIHFSSGDSGILKVNANGLVQALSVGNAAINIISGDINRTVEIEVYTPTESIEMLPETLRVPLNAAKTLAPVILPSSSRETIVFRSADESIALADESGNVIGLALGNTTVTVESDGVLEKVTVEVYIPAEAIENLPESIRLPVGASTTLTPSVMPMDTTDTLAYESDNPGVAKVNTDGEVELLSAGETTISVWSGDVVGEIPVTAYVAVERITGLPEGIRVALGDSQRLQPIVLPSASKETVQYQSANENIAIADQTGNITGLSIGHTVIWVDCDGIHEEVPVEIYIPVESIEGVPTSLRLMKEEKTLLEPVLLPADTTETVGYQTSDSSVVSAHDSGEVQAIAAGVAEIYVLGGEVRETISVEVYVPAERIEGLPAAIMLAKGQNRQMRPEVLPEDAREPVQYESMNPDVVTVDGNGTVYAVGVGATSIEVTCGEVMETVPVTVVIPAESISGLEHECRLAVGKSFALKVTVYPTDTTDTVVSFESSNTGIVAVDASGKMTAKKAGKAEVTVTCGEIRERVAVEVYIPATPTPKPTPTPTPKPTATPTPKPTAKPTARPTVAPTPRPDVYKSVTGGTIAVRRTATMSRSNNVGEVYTGEIVKALDVITNSEGSFVMIQTKGNVTGYIPAEYARTYTNGDAATKFLNQRVQKPTVRPTAQPAAQQSNASSSSGSGGRAAGNFTIYIWYGEYGSPSPYQATWTYNQPDAGHPTYMASMTFANHKFVSMTGSLPNSIRSHYISKYEAYRE